MSTRDRFALAYITKHMPQQEYDPNLDKSKKLYDYIVARAYEFADMVIGSQASKSV